MHHPIRTATSPTYPQQLALPLDGTNSVSRPARRPAESPAIPPPLLWVGLTPAARGRVHQAFLQVLREVIGDAGAD